LPVGYELTLVIDNYIIPVSEMQFVEATGVYIWKPGLNKSFESWQPGKHTIKISWDTIIGLPDYGEYIWEFTSY